MALKLARENVRVFCASLSKRQTLTKLASKGIESFVALAMTVCLTFVLSFRSFFSPRREHPLLGHAI